MIKYALVCDEEHAFEGWFDSSDAFDDQAERGLLACPQCGSAQVRKQIMAPAIGGRAGAGPSPEQLMRQLAKQVRNHIRDTHTYVGDRFAEEARAMHCGDKDPAPIYGATTPEEAKALKEEGVPAQPLPDAFVPRPPQEGAPTLTTPAPKDTKKLN